MKCYHAIQTGPDNKAIQLALRKGYSLTSEVCIAVSELRELDGILGEVLGERAVKFLKKDNQAQYFGKSLRVITRKVATGPQYSAMLVAYLPFDELEVLMAKHPKQDFIYLAPTPEALAAYLAKYSSRSV